jgi:hypothetical protein
MTETGKRNPACAGNGRFQNVGHRPLQLWRCISTEEAIRRGEAR